MKWRGGNKEKEASEGFVYNADLIFKIGFPKPKSEKKNQGIVVYLIL